MDTIKMFCICFLIFLLTGCVGLPAKAASNPPKAQVYYPSTSWRSAQPEALGMDSELLARMFQQIEAQQLNLHSLLVVRSGYLVTEAYFDPYTQNQPQYLASVTKSVISTLVGVAVQKGYIQNTDQTLVSFFKDRPIANLDERKKAITLKDLLTLTAGLACDDSPFTDSPRMEQSGSWVQFMLDAQMDAQPGTKWNYCGGMVHLLSAILQKATGMSARDFANRYLFEPMDIPTIPEIRWQMDPQGRSIGPYGLYLTPRDMAKLGYLYLNDGKWNDTQILSADWVKAASTSYITRDNGLGYGYLWTVDAEKGYFAALGWGGQHIYVVPAKKLVIVFTATLPATKMNEDFFPLKALVDTYILPAVKSDQELAANEAGAARLNEYISKAAFPKQAVPPLPEGAQQWSGLVYQVDDNPYQWQKIAFEIKPGAETMTLFGNGQPGEPPVGMDHQYRIFNQADLFAPIAVRGAWLDGSTLLVREIFLGELVGLHNDITFRVVFSPDEINVTSTYTLTGEQIKIHGVRVEK